MIKLYSWQPKGHGEYSFFVASESEEDARKSVNAYIAKSELSPYDTGGWGTDYYELTVLNPGEVIDNPND